jgi:outer membrane protein
MTRKLADVAAAAALSILIGAGVSQAQNAPPGQAANVAREITLPQAVEVALKNNPTIQAADSYADAVRHAVAAAKAGYYPHLDFSEGLVRSNNPVFVFSSLLTERQFTAQDFALGSLNFPLPLDNFRAQFAAAMPLYDAGQTSRAVRSARLDSQEAQQGAARTRQEVIYSVINAYLGQLLAQESIRVAEASVKSTSADLGRARARQEQGQALMSDVLSAQVQLAQAQEELIRAQNDVATAQASLDVAMGLPEDAPELAQGPLSETVFDSGNLADRQQRALDLRPDYQQALIGNEKAGNAAAGARAQFLPTLSIFSSVEQDNETFAAHGGNNWAAGATLNFDLFDGGARRAQLAESHARERQAEALRTQMASGIRLQVREAYLSLNAARQRVEVSRDAASQAEESLTILRNRYEAGLVTITDLLSAETAHARAQRDHLSAVYDDRIAYAALELATGELGPGSAAVVR